MSPHPLSPSEGEQQRHLARLVALQDTCAAFSVRVRVRRGHNLIAAVGRQAERFCKVGHPVMMSVERSCCPQTIFLKLALVPKRLLSPGPTDSPSQVRQISHQLEGVTGMLQAQLARSMGK